MRLEAACEFRGVLQKVFLRRAAMSVSQQTPSKTILGKDDVLFEDSSRVSKNSPFCWFFDGFWSDFYS